MTAFLKKMLSTVIDDALMPTGKNLVPSLFFAVLITILNIVCRLFKWSYGFSLWGCIGAILILLALLIIERSEYSAVSRLYRDAELRVKDIKARQQAVSAAIKNGRASRVREERGSDAYRRAVHGHEDAGDDDGFNVGNTGSEEQFGGDADVDGYDEDDTD